MGHYRVTVVAVGGHGCQRERGSGDSVVGCERSDCPDCITREYVRRLKRVREEVQVAQIEHWPADLGYEPSKVVVDDLLTGIRRGEFPEKDDRQRAMYVPLQVVFVDVNGASKVVPIQPIGSTTVEEIINQVMLRAEKYPNPGRRIRSFVDPQGKKHYFGEPPEDEKKTTIWGPADWLGGGSSNDLTFGDGVGWRLGRPSCFSLNMEARHLPKGEPDRVAIYPEPYMRECEPLEVVTPNA